MEPLIALLVVYLIAVLVVVPIWAIVKILRHDADVDALQRRMLSQEADLRDLGQTVHSIPASALARLRDRPPEAPAGPAPARVAPAAPLAPVVPAAPPAAAVPAPAAPPRAPIPAPAAPAPVVAAAATPGIGEPPPLAAAAGTSEAPAPAERAGFPALPQIDWEQFMGAKLFAWLGGLALFLGVAFFVKYSFEHDLVPPQVRVALGFLLGAGLIVGGLRVPYDRYRITAQTLVAAGVVSLYTVTFACNSIYHFAFFGPVATFLLMALVTAGAFALAVRLDAQVIAVLGILGGFLTPVLVSTGQDNPAGLFGYIGLLVVGLTAVALHRGWLYLIPLGATGTVLMLVAWADRFYAPEKTGTAMTVCLAFCALFAGAAEAARRLGRESRLVSVTASALPAVAFCFALYFLDYPAVAARAGLLFTFVLLASLFTLVVAWREAMGFLVAGAAAACAIVMARWAVDAFTPGQVPVVVSVCLGFSALYFVAYLGARRLGRAGPPVLGAAVGMPAVALVFAFLLVERGLVDFRPGILLALVFASDALLLALSWLDERTARLHLGAGLATFVILAAWSARSLTDALLPWALGASLAFAAAHTALPVLLERRRPASAPSWWSQLFPPLALLLMLFPVWKSETVSLLVWPAILLVDVAAVALALVSAALEVVAAVLLLTLAAAGMFLFRIPAELVLGPTLLLVLGGFAVFFFFAALWLVRRLGAAAPAERSPSGIPAIPPTALPALSALLPFVLLIMACARLAVPDPSAVFGLGLLLVVLTLGLARLLAAEWLPACALAGTAALELAWHARHFSAAAPAVPLAWYLLFYAVFAAYPFAFRRTFLARTGPWAAAALSGVAQFWLVYRAVKLGWPNDVLGLLPAAFAVAPFASLVAVLRSPAADEARRMDQLAWFGGVALFFITLIFPVQFDHQWLTVAWALEGAALLWLFHRVPHPGLRATGAVLLAIAFARLALNPAVLSYHARGDVPILNWYLWAYGLSAASLLWGARLLAPPRETVLGVNAPRVLDALGIVLLFLLVNIEIADYFTSPGSLALAFQFSGNFARDMSYTIAWALFALGLLAAGIWSRQRGLRYAAIALLCVSLLKLFFHDLARLEALYRVGALFGVAAIAILASFAYQRFLPSHDKTVPTQP